MSTRRRWLLVTLAGSLGALLVALWLVQRWVGGAGLRDHLAAELGLALGVPVTFGQVVLDVWPRPALALVDMRVQSTPELLVRRLEARPAVAALLSGRLELATLVVRAGELPQAGLDDALARRNKSLAVAGAQIQSADAAPGRSVAPQRLLLDGLTWRSAAGEAITVDAEARLGADAWPELLTAKVVAGTLQGTQLRLERVSGDYQLRMDVAGGSVIGRIGLVQSAEPPALWQLNGQLETKGVALAALTRNRLSGALQASTTLQASAATAGALADALHTQSRFAVQGAVVHGVDLARAVQTVGLSRGGETRLDALAGQLNSKGRAVVLNNLVASSGLLSASGNVALSPARALSGRVNVNLGASVVGDAVGVPLLVSGTLDAPQLTLTRAAMVGAAIGTLVLPGVGTGAGASLGDKIGGKLQGLFGK